MMNLLKNFVMNAYVALRGKSIVTTVMTDNTFNYHYSVLDMATQKEEKFIDLICHQFKHEVKYKSWWMIDRSFYSYRVEVVFIKEVSNESQFPHYDFPHMCWKWLHTTHYPHLCAINAYLDNSKLVWSRKQKSK